MSEVWTRLSVAYLLLVQPTPVLASGLFFQPEKDPPRPAKLVKITYRRVNSHNRRAFLFDHLQRHNWSHFYHMNSCQEMVDYFYSFILHLLNLYMPTIRSSSNNFDKPWVTQEFRNLVKQRQRAYMSSQKSLYCKLRNKSATPGSFTP